MAQQRRAPRLLIWLPVPVVAMLFVWFIDAQGARTVLASLFVSGQLLVGLVALWQQRALTVGRGQYLVGAAFLVVIATFVCFALFPVAVVLARSFPALVFAFIVGGLREIGEPSRKAMIVDFAEPHLRARTVGLYYLVRSLTITPAAALGGLLWKVEPQAPFVIAGVIGIVGTIVFAATVDERYAG